VNIFCIRPKGFNVGNDAIYLGLQAALEEGFGCFVNLITLPATSRYESHARGGLTSKTIHEINQYGDGVIVGGGNLYENGELDLNIAALQRLEPPMMLFSLSRGRIYNRLDELVDRTDVMQDQLIRALNDKAMFSLARDEATLGYLKNLGLTNVVLGGCPTIYLDRIAKRLPNVADADKGCTLVSVRHPSLMNIALQRQMRVHDEIGAILRLLRDHGHKDIRLLCHDHRDIPFAASFGNMPYVYIPDPHAYLALLKHCRLNVTYRVHSALPCMALGTSFIKLSYDERALSLMSTVGFGDWNIDIVKSKNVVQDVADRLANLGEIARIKRGAITRWAALKGTQDSAMKEFAAAVRAYSQASDSSPPLRVGE
jgi:polysaccharide pyruvyl transferase WcaK-like protein